MSASPATTVNRRWAINSQRLVYWLSRHWLLVLSLVIGLWVGLPFLAPLLMKVGWPAGAEAIYGVYAFQCHQLPQRSFFLFGEQAMYSLPEIANAWPGADNPMTLRGFVGNPQMGWKVAWSDRMAAMYGSLLLWGALFWPLRKRIRPLSPLLLILLLLPMLIDGSSHMVSDLMGGIDGGFRYDNVWLANLTGHTLSAGFYYGNAFGSFNSSMRLLTGFLFGLGVVWFAYPRLDIAFGLTAEQIETKFERAELPL